jgi:hypothetical protein
VGFATEVESSEAIDDASQHKGWTNV